jgi:hypothetical protein
MVLLLQQGLQKIFIEIKYTIYKQVALPNTGTVTVSISGSTSALTVNIYNNLIGNFLATGTDIVRELV